jgi:pantoate--beta-alanine ligase
MKTPDVITTVVNLRAVVAGWRRDAATVGLVPTMGALHEGHLSLIAEAANRSERVVVSIFVNPRQFAPTEDLQRYPRNPEQDRARIAAQGLTDVIFVPERDEIYPDGFATEITVGGPAVGLESDFRPHFFAGVATVVARLLIAVAPDVAVFGEKDFQQLLVVRHMVRDLGLPVEIVAAPIMREADGLAMSSRNAYLSARERQVAGRLNCVLNDVAQRVREGTSVVGAERIGRDALLTAGFDSIDYVAIRDAHTLQPLERASSDMRILAAATISGTRLIDNMPV